MGHVDGDEDVRLLALEAQQRQDEGGEVGRRARGLPRVGARGLGRDQRVGRYVRADARELGVGRVPDLDAFHVGADDVLEVLRERPAVDLGRAARGPDALRDLDDYAREAVLVDKDLLIVWDRTDRTVNGEVSCWAITAVLCAFVPLGVIIWL